MLGRLEAVDIDQITHLTEGSLLHDSKLSLCELMKLSPDQIDYEQLQRKDVSKSSICIENEADALEENQNEIVLDDLLDIS